MNTKISPTPTRPEDLVSDRIDVDGIKKIIQEKLGLSDGEMAVYTEWLKQQSMQYTASYNVPLEFEP